MRIAVYARVSHAMRNEIARERINALVDQCDLPSTLRDSGPPQDFSGSGTLPAGQ
jgi:hypothetical protein